MPRSSVRLRWIWGAALLVLSLPAMTRAHPPLHTALRRSDPAKDAELSVSPRRIALWFTGRPQLSFSRIRLTGPGGEVALDRVVADTGDGFYADIPQPLAPGVYAVQWRTGSSDGHPIRGEFTFRVLGASTAGLRDAIVASAQQPNDSLDIAEYRSVRWIEFVALLTVLGALGFRHGVLPPLAARGVPTLDAADRARRLGQSAVLLYGVAALVRLYTESRAMHGPDTALAVGAVLDIVTKTTWGIGWLSGVIGALFLIVGWAISRRTVMIGTPLALTGALGMVLSPAMSGHAIASDHFILSVTLDMVHVAAAGIWVGGVLLVVFAGIPAMRRITDGNPDAAISALVNSFHPLALICAPLVVVAGLGTSWIRLGGFDALVGTPYGQTLLYKVGLVAIVLGLGAYNAARARRRLGSSEGTRRFRLTAAVEIFFAALVVAATAALVVTPAPADSFIP